jgi:hypothetical protein
MRVLADFKAGNGWNRDSWIKESQQWGSAKSQAMSRALAEAWAWLEARGLVAWNPEQNIPNAYFVTRLGEEALETGAAKMEAAQRLGMSLHPLIAQTVERQFLLGEYELAVFAAMKQVEITVRDLGGYPNDLLGTKLMQAAFFHPVSRARWRTPIPRRESASPRWSSSRAPLDYSRTAALTGLSTTTIRPSPRK